MNSVATLDIGCEACGATLRVEASQKTARCPYCDSPKVVERPVSAERPEPAFVVPFVIPEKDALSAVKTWLRKTSFFAPSAFRRSNPTKTRAVYLPAWLYGAVAESEYSADIGEEYTETQTVRTSNGTSTRTVTKTEWRTLSGRRSAWLRDVVVSASRGVPNEELERVEPFGLGALHRYQAALISGWPAEEPSTTKESCQQVARAEGMETVTAQLDAFMPGDKHRNLQHRTQLTQEVLDLTLLPLWVFATRWSEEHPPVRILVNGQTGQVGGKAPISKTKVLLTIVAGLAIVGGIVAAIALSNS